MFGQENRQGAGIGPVPCLLSFHYVEDYATVNVPSSWPA